MDHKFTENSRKKSAGKRSISKTGMSKRGSVFLPLINEDRLLERFFEILKIKSPSKSEKELVGYLNDKLANLGVQLSIDDAGEKLGGDSGNLTGFFKSDYPSSAKENDHPIFLCAHLDTVICNGDILPVIRDGKVVNENSNCILGGDDKVAIAAILEALEVIKENRIGTKDFYLIFTVEEEIAVLGARYLDLDSIKAKYGFVFDGEGDVGLIFNEAPYHNTFDIEITGKAAHSGIEPEKGINSIKAAADAIAKLDPGRVDNQTTFNIAMINGGTATNIVPEKTKVRAEARSLVEEKLEKISDLIVKTFRRASENLGAEIKIEKAREYDGFKINKDEVPMKIAGKALSNMGIKAKVVSTGGGSDINIFNSKGKISVNLSSGMENVHTNNEFVKIEQLKNLAALVIELCTVKI